MIADISTVSQRSAGKDSSKKLGIVSNDNGSAVVQQFNMHQKNKQRIQNLMALLGVRNAKYTKVTNDLDIKVGESMSNLDAAS